MKIYKGYLWGREPRKGEEKTLLYHRLPGEMGRYVRFLLLQRGVQRSFGILLSDVQD